jgi:small conductance mechanosensitive channel
MSVGDVVDLGGHSGVIEGMTIRSVRVRDVSGAVHTIPFSSVTTVVNMTKDFAFAVFSVNISYEEDVDKAVAAMEQVGHELQADPVIAPSILAPIEVFGLDAFGEQGMRLQGRMKTRAGRQWAVTREFNRRIKQTFDGLGISMPHAQKVMLRSVPAPAT